MDQVTQLDQQIAELQAKRQEIITSQRAKAAEEIRAVIRQYGFSAQELGLGTHKTKTAVSREAKYANPQNPAQTWAGGKGKRPNWVRAHLERGGRLEDLLIKR